MKNEFNQTIQGTYSLVKMPDGTEVLMQKLSDGSWVTTAERIKQQDREQFEARFKDTETQPNDALPTDTDILTLNDDAYEKLSKEHNMSKRHLYSHLLEIIGDPEKICAGLVEPRKVKDPCILRNVDKMIQALNDPKWNKVWKILTNME